ncbi:fimbrial adhesin protein precursor [Xenorhabdus mauleonii]|uniref:Fimbrial adhesin protein n=1 Tax=Xenorhabdus mauleonii TaxID=351675 RepID=A0A1I3IYX0_9GAMM|nr:fimbrial protein [Xenorhabdus mauleonii]PHM46042.1 fimbrial adhesin protein precursor [Xenorhabdus mauleonii]SFI53179.1 Pilin (type 1 fimbria component protein) [Xenorhabdus mauleonii]
MFIFYKKYPLLLAAIGVLTGLFINDSYAGSCRFKPGLTEKEFNISGNSEYIVGRDIRVWKSIGAYPINMNIMGTQSYSCSSQEKIVWEVNGHSHVITNNGPIYDTDIPGIGMQIRNQGEQAEIDFVKTKHEIGFGTMKPITITARVSDLRIYSIKIIGIKFSMSSCNLENGNILVPMGKIGTRDFSGINSTAGERPFDINLECNSNTPIGLVFGATSSGSTNDVLGVEQDNGSAEGVGIQVLYQEQPVIFNSLVKLGNSEHGTYSIPFKARYIQTADHITAGKVKATATLDINYP